MKDLLAAERYARALFEIALKAGQDARIEEALVSFSAALKNAPDAWRFLNNPHVPLADKRRFLERLYAADDKTLLDFLSVLLEKNRFSVIHDIAVSFKKISDTSQGEGLVEIRTATPLSARSEESLLSRLEKIAGLKLSVKKTVDPALIGGVSVKINNKILDGSVKSRIENLKRELVKKRSI